MGGSNNIIRNSVDDRTMPERRPADDLPMIVGFIVIRRRLAGGPAVTAGVPADRRRDIGRKLCHLRNKSGDRRTVTWRRPADVRCLNFKDRVQGRENPAVICRCQKTGIGGKSGDHPTIYKACDVGFNRWEM